MQLAALELGLVSALVDFFVRTELDTVLISCRKLPSLSCNVVSIQNVFAIPARPLKSPTYSRAHRNIWKSFLKF